MVCLCENQYRISYHGYDRDSLEETINQHGRHRDVRQEEHFVSLGAYEDRGARNKKAHQDKRHNAPDPPEIGPVAVEVPIWRSGVSALLLSKEMKGGLTPLSLHSIRDAVHQSLNRRNPRNMLVEQVECRETPPRCPEEDIIATCKYPQDGQIRERSDTGTVGNISPSLFPGARPAGARVSDVQGS